MRFRSKNEVEGYLKKHSEYASQGVKLEELSFQTPRPLQEDYAKKRSQTPSYDISGANDVNYPISRVPLDGRTCFLGEPAPSVPSEAAPLHVPDDNSSKGSRLMGSLFCVLMSMMPEAKEYGF